MSEVSERATSAALEASFGVAAEGGVQESRATIARRAVLFRHASPALLAAFRPAFAHVLDATVAPDTPSLTVDIWDSSTGAPPPMAIPPAVGDEAWYEREGPRQVFMLPSRKILTVYDEQARHAWWWIADADALPWYEQAAPMRHLLNWWVASEGLALVHAAAIGGDDGCALIVGRGGAGKSTLALASLASGMRFCGDDMVVLERSDDWTVHTVWASARVVAGGEHLVPHVSVARLVDDESPEVKLVADVYGQFGEAVAAAMPVRLVVMPEIGAATPPEPDRAARAALELATSTFLHMSGGAPRSTLSMLARMLEQVPVYRLGVGEDVGAGVAEIARLLAGSPRRV